MQEKEKKEWEEDPPDQPNGTLQLDALPGGRPDSIRPAFDHRLRRPLERVLVWCDGAANGSLHN